MTPPRRNYTIRDITESIWFAVALMLLFTVTLALSLQAGNWIATGVSFVLLGASLGYAVLNVLD